MADAASTGTLVLVALSGGAGALIGTFIGQGVQLHRDKKQRQHENDRHDREREQALEDAARERREDRYVALLSELVRLHRLLRSYVELIQAYAKHRDELESELNQSRKDFLTLLADSSAEASRRQYGLIDNLQQQVSVAVYEAYGVASQRVREMGEALVERRLSGLEHEQLTTPSGRLIMSGPNAPRLGTYGESVAVLVTDVGSVQQLIESLDHQLREELRLA